MSNVSHNLKSNLKKEGLLTFSNILVITISFLLLGLFVNVVFLTQNTVKGLEQQAQISIFFEDDFSEDMIMQVKARLDTDDRVLSTNYVSKQQAYELFREINKSEPVLLESLTPDVLPASIEVKTKNIGDLSSVAKEYQSLDGVEEVTFFEDVISRFRTFSLVIYIVGFVLVGIFFVISYAVVIATLRLTISAKKEEIEIMKLVGATDEYVKRPFLQQGTFFGLISSSIASLVLLLVTFLLMTSGYLPEVIHVGLFPNLKIQTYIFELAIALILMLSGFLLGYGGSRFTLKKYLNY